MNKLSKFVLFLLLSGNTIVIAQPNPWYNLTEVDPVVSEPLYYWAFISYKTDGYIYQFNDSGSVWSSKFKMENEKNGDKKYIQYTEYEDFFGNGFDTAKHYDCNYIKDSQGRITEALKTTFWPYYTYSKLKFFYTGNMLDSLQEYETIKGKDSLKIVTHFKYNGAGKRITDSLVWFFSPKPTFMYPRLYKYDNSGKCIENETFHIKRYIYQYYPDGGMKKSTYYNWDGNKYVLSNESHFTYYNDGSVDSVITYHKVGLNLAPDVCYKHYYNNNKTLSALTSDRYNDSAGFVNYDSIPFSLLPNNQYDTSYEYAWINNSWILSDRRYIFDKMSPLSIQNSEKSQLKIYPNPAHSFITVELPKNSGGKEISITDITGKTIRQFPINDLVTEMPLDIPPGIYFLRSGGMVARFVKQ